MERIRIQHKTFPQITYYKTGSGPAILLVHGFPANRHLWRHIIPGLARQYTVLLPDFFEQEGDWQQQGHTSTRELARAFHDILEQEQVDRVLIAGHSMGGYMGLAFAALYPQRLAGLSLIHSSPVGDDAARAEGRKKTVAILEKGGKSPFLKKMVPALFSETFRKAEPETVQRQLDEALAVNDAALVAFYRAIMERSETTAVSRTAVFPLQNIIGKKDTLANITKELAPQNLSNTNFVSIYEDEAHMAMLEKPEALLKDLLHFAAYCWHR
ncbi:MAG: alpha/beta hydrolase [Chitinophagaceae bacterium]|nr:alpha/beta hydrolase [Chitinophagaceae bacterium]